MNIIIKSHLVFKKLIKVPHNGTKKKTLISHSKTITHFFPPNFYSFIWICEKTNLFTHNFFQIWNKLQYHSQSINPISMTPCLFLKICTWYHHHFKHLELCFLRLFSYKHVAPKWSLSKIKKLCIPFNIHKHIIHTSFKKLCLTFDNFHVRIYD